MLNTIILLSLSFWSAQPIFPAIIYLIMAVILYHLKIIPYAEYPRMILITCGFVFVQVSLSARNMLNEETLAVVGGQ
jgi:hypothetical protein